MSAQQDAWSANEYNKTAAFVYSDKFTQAVIQLLEPQNGERIVDFGCGSGELTKGLLEAVGETGHVVGIDASPNMIEKARQNGILHAHVLDLQSIPWEEQSISMDLIPSSYDAIFSNAALHWCRNSPIAVVQNAWKLLKPGGRFVGEMGGFMNVVGLRSSLYHALASRGYDPSKLDPWYFPSDTTYGSILEQIGFRVEMIGLHPRMTHVPNGLRAWLDLFARKTMLATLTDEEAGAAMDEVMKACEMDMKDENGSWHVMYVRLRFKAIKPVEQK